MPQKCPVIICKSIGKIFISQNDKKTAQKIHKIATNDPQIEIHQNIIFLGGREHLMKEQQTAYHDAKKQESGSVTVEIAVSVNEYNIKVQQPCGRK